MVAGLPQAWSWSPLNDCISLPLETFSPKEMTFTNRSKPDADEKLSDHNTSPDAGNDAGGVAGGVGGGTAGVGAGVTEPMPEGPARSGPSVVHPMASTTRLVRVPLVEV